MRKHIIGFALFIFIVVTGVVTYSFFRVTTKKTSCDLDKYRSRSAVSLPPERTEVNPVSHELKSFQVDLGKNIATIEVKLDCNSADTPYKGMVINFGVATADEPYRGIEIGSEFLKDPFAKGNSVTKTFKFTTSARVRLNPNQKNYYGYMEFIDQDEDTGVRKLVLIESNRMANAIPALVRHPLKK